MRHTLTEKFLLFLADWFDFNSRWTWRTFTAMSDDPRLHRHRHWLEKYLRNKRKREKLQQTIYRLKKQELLQQKIFTKEKEGLILTLKGQLKILHLKNKQKGKKKNSGNRWLMVIFDIPERIRKIRDSFRRGLYEFGFQQLQKSVWITPYDVLEELEEIINIYNLKKYIKFLFIKEIKQK